MHNTKEAGVQDTAGARVSAAAHEEEARAAGEDGAAAERVFPVAGG